MQNDDSNNIRKAWPSAPRIWDAKHFGDTIGYLTETRQVTGSPPHMGKVETRRLIPLVVPLSTPITLSVVAGYVDTCTYLGLFGVFVAQLTGSLVLTGTAFFGSESGAFAKLLAIPAFFFAGAAVTVLVHSLKEDPRAALAWSLMVECILLIGLSASCMARKSLRGLDAPDTIVALLFGMAAMGAQSALVRLLIPGAASTNVMTTNTTRLAISAAEMLFAWIQANKAGTVSTSNAVIARARREVTSLLPIWLGFLTGTVLGAIAYTNFGLPCVLLAILPVGSLALWYAHPLNSEPDKPAR
jgi:uncharacterized membrane protein YoaK (UPF0700 family)